MPSNLSVCRRRTYPKPGGDRPIPRHLLDAAARSAFDYEHAL